MEDLEPLRVEVALLRKEVLASADDLTVAQAEHEGAQAAVAFWNKFSTILVKDLARIPIGNINLVAKELCLREEARIETLQWHAAKMRAWRETLLALRESHRGLIELLEKHRVVLRQKEIELRALREQELDNERPSPER